MLEVSNLCKAYALHSSARQRLWHLFSGKQVANSHVVLANVSFKLKQGLCLGVVGDNGAGKSTLLKLIAGTLQPSTGEVRRDGRLTAILELGAGFHPDFSGRDNIRFAGALIGISQNEMCQLEPEIIDFAELAAAIDRPIKTYSSGMLMRLAFSLVTAVAPDILIIDEALAVGDQNFQRKCIDRIEQFRERGCTILFCSHSLYQVRRLCEEAIWIDHGHVAAQGDTETVLSAYETHVRKQISNARNMADNGETTTLAASRELSTRGGIARVEAVKVGTLDDATPPRLTSNDLSITVQAYVPGSERPNIAVLLERADNVCISGLGTHGEGGVPPRMLEPGLWQSTLTFPELPLYSGEYQITVFLFDQTGTLVYEEWRACQRFVVINPTLEIGLLRLAHRWT